MTLNELLTQPWTVCIEQRSDDGEYFLATIEELPGLSAVGETPEELDGALRDALESHLASYVEAGEEPPLPRAQDQGFSEVSIDYSGGAPEHVLRSSSSHLYASVTRVPSWREKVVA